MVDRSNRVPCQDQHPRTDEQSADQGCEARPFVIGDDCGDRREHGPGSAGQRIHEGEVTSPVAGRKGDEVGGVKDGGAAHEGQLAKADAGRSERQQRQRDRGVEERGEDGEQPRAGGGDLDSLCQRVPRRM